MQSLAPDFYALVQFSSDAFFQFYAGATRKCNFGPRDFIEYLAQILNRVIAPLINSAPRDRPIPKWQDAPELPEVSKFRISDFLFREPGDCRKLR